MSTPEASTSAASLSNPALGGTLLDSFPLFASGALWTAFLFFIWGAPTVSLTEKSIWTTLAVVAVLLILVRIIRYKIVLAPTLTTHDPGELVEPRLETREFTHYLPHLVELRREFEEERLQILSASADARSRTEEETHAPYVKLNRKIVADRESFCQRVAPTTSLVAILLFASYVSAPNELLAQLSPTDLSVLDHLDIARVLLLLAAGALATRLVYESRQTQSLLRDADSNFKVAANAYNAQVGLIVDEGIGRTINRVFRGLDILAFPTAAPRLIELDVSAIVPLRSHEYVRDFIESHESSAIGIAGARGSGKSTLMRAMVNDRALTRNSVLLSAPVAYDSSDFERHILRQVAANILGDDVEAVERLTRARVYRTRLVSGAMAAMAGIVLIACGVLSVQYPQLGVMTTLGIVVFVYGGGSLIYARINILSMDKVGFATISASKRLAAQAVRMLTWELERGEVSKNVGKLASMGEMQDEESVKAKERGRSRPDIAALIRELLETFANEISSNRFIVCIDELDKLSSAEDLVQVVNGLKDLFHIKGVHFVVSVSTDALASFERRGLPNRDAFDSSFDTVLEVSSLKSSESLRVIQSRATGFPEPLGLLCHAWSGGLPRDLLRAARRCVEIQKFNEELLTVSEIAERLVIGDLTALVDGLLSSSLNDQREILWSFRSFLEGRPGSARRTEAMQALLQLTGRGESTFHAAVGRACVGLCIIEFSQRATFKSSFEASPASTETPLDEAIFALSAGVRATALSVLPRLHAVTRCIHVAQGA